jgi:O-antigen ligase
VIGSESSNDFKIVSCLLLLALAVGGAGISFPLLELLLELAAIATAAYFLLTPHNWHFDRIALLTVALAGAILLLPLIQLVPLPPEIWRSLPGRELPARLDTILGWSSWRPLTLDVEGTIRAFLSLLPPAAAFLGCLLLRGSERVRLLWIVSAFAVLNALLGIVQFATGGGLTPYPSGHIGYALGFFVNRNHSAALSIVAIPIVAALGRLEMARGKATAPVLAAVLSVLLILAVAVLATTSRMALLLLPFALTLSMGLTFYRQPPWRVVLPSIFVVISIGFLLFANGGFDRTLIRFSSLSDPRLSFWADTRWALQQYGLAGTGFGSFMRVFQTAESLDGLGPAIVNHAHDDYLEIALEGGLPAIVLLLAFLGLFAAALFRSAAVRKRVEANAVTAAAAAGVLALLACSLVDYPLRMPALSTVLAVLCSVVLPPRSKLRSQGRELVKYERQWGRAIYRRLRLGCVVMAALLVPVAVQAAMSARALQDEDYDSAARWAWWSTNAHELRSTTLLATNNLQQAEAAASTALELSPISAPAARTEGLIHLAQGHSDVGMRLMDIAVLLGWRDPLTQLWAIGVAEQSGQTEMAVQRAQALFQQEKAFAPATTLLLQSPDQEHVAGRLAALLAQKPEWRKAFFNAAADLPQGDVQLLTNVLSRLGRSEMPPNANELKPLLTRLVADDDFQNAQKVWQSAHIRTLLDNGDFEQVERGNSSNIPRFWGVAPQISSNVGVVDMAGGHHALHISTAKLPRHPIIYQQVMLSPGVYALSFRARMAKSGTAGIDWELRCQGSSVGASSNATIAANQNWQAVRALLTVPDQNCPIQTLALKLTSDTSTSEFWLDDVELNPTTR